MVPNEEGSSEVVPVIVPAAPARGVVITRPRGGGQLVRDQGAPAARPWAATGSIDAERLATWAYRDQMVDRHAAQGLHRIEAAAAGYEPSGSSSDGCAALGRIAHLGCRVDAKGASVSALVHPAADAVAWVLAGIPHGERVAYWARLGGRPTGWAIPKRQWRAVTWIKPWVEAQPERFRGKPTHCEIIRVGSAVEAERFRAEYVEWWEALDRMAWELSMRALGFVVLRPSAPRQPWLGAGQP